MAEKKKRVKNNKTTAIYYYGTSQKIEYLSKKTGRIYIWDSKTSKPKKNGKRYPVVKVLNEDVEDILQMKGKVVSIKKNKAGFLFSK